jgi:hypothetical protein
MYGVAAKVAQEIRMLLQNDSVDTRPSHQVAQHHARWAATCDTTLNLQRSGHVANIAGAYRNPKPGVPAQISFPPAALADIVFVAVPS